MSTPSRDPLLKHVAPLTAVPVGAYGLFEARLDGQMVGGGFSAEEALSNARRALQAGGSGWFAPLPVVEQLDQGRGLVIRRERLPQLRHRLPSIVACADLVRERFLSAWVQHLAESRYPHAEGSRVAANLARILAVDDAVAWLTWRHGPGLEPRDPLTDPWFEEETCRPDCCGVETAAGDVEYVGRPGRGFSICRWCSETEREEAERG